MKLSNIKRKTKYFLAGPGAFINGGIASSREVYFQKRLLRMNRSIRLPSIDIQTLIGNENTILNTYSFLPGTSMITDILLLKSLAKRFTNCAYLEIGSWRGESLVNIAEVAAECYSVSLSDADMKSLGYPDSVSQVNDFFIKNTQNITLIKQNSQTFDFKTLNKKFDLIFIDGDHTYKGVLTDTINAFKLLKDKNSIIVWHDYGFTPEDVNFSVLSAIFDGLPPPEHNNLYHVSNTLSAIFCREKFDARIISPNEKPDKIFTVGLKVNSIKPENKLQR